MKIEIDTYDAEKKTSRQTSIEVSLWDFDILNSIDSWLYKHDFFVHRVVAGVLFFTVVAYWFQRFGWF